MELFTRDETAQRLRISTRQLDKLTKASAIGCVRIGSRVLYREEDIAAFVAAHALVPVKYEYQRSN